MKIQVMEGTPLHNAEDLCQTCRGAVIVQGRSMGETAKGCRMMPLEDYRPPEIVTKCSAYSDKRHPPMHVMAEMAWVIRTSEDRKQIGFVRVKDMTAEEQQKYHRENRANPYLPGWDE